jgi:hypothetical protein
MPFKSEKQRRYLYSQKPEVAKKFAVDSAKKGKIIKLRGGGMDMGNKSNQAQSAALGNTSVGRRDSNLGGKTSTMGGSGNVLNTQTNNTQTNNTQTNQVTAKANSNFFNPVTTGLNLVGSLTANIPGLGFAFDVGKKAVKGIQKTTRTQTAKGETIFGNTKPGNKGMPITRDYYRTAGKPLDVMSPQGSQYMKDAGFLKGPKTITDGGGREDNRKSLCPDGTNPPCKLPATQIKQPVSTPNTFLSGFKAYDDGGEVVISSNVDKSLL